MKGEEKIHVAPSYIFFIIIYILLFSLFLGISCCLDLVLLVLLLLLCIHDAVLVIVWFDLVAWVDDGTDEGMVVGILLRMGVVWFIPPHATKIDSPVHSLTHSLTHSRSCRTMTLLLMETQNTDGVRTTNEICD